MNDENKTIFCGKSIGINKAPLIVAEIGFNHNGNVDLACKMIKSAAQSGADIVKLQTFIGNQGARPRLAESRNIFTRIFSTLPTTP